MSNIKTEFHGTSSWNIISTLIRNQNKGINLQDKRYYLDKVIINGSQSNDENGYSAIRMQNLFTEDQKIIKRYFKNENYSIIKFLSDLKNLDNEVIFYIKPIDSNKSFKLRIDNFQWIYQDYKIASIRNKLEEISDDDLRIDTLSDDDILMFNSLLSSPHLKAILLVVLAVKEVPSILSKNYQNMYLTQNQARFEINDEDVVFNFIGEPTLISLSSWDCSELSSETVAILKSHKRLAELHINWGKFHDVTIMTEEQFLTIAQLIRSKDSPSRNAARLILVKRYRPAEAARVCDCSLQSASQSAKNFEAAYKSIKRAFHVK